MAVTHSTIAKYTGLSRQTVAFILGDRPHLFREETRNKVFEAAERLGYRRNVAAVAMTRGRYNAIGLLQTSKPGLGALHQNVLAALMEEMRAKRMHLSLGQVDDDVLTDESAMPQLMNDWAVDGLLISYVANFPERLAEILERYRLPALWMNVMRPFDAVYPDDYDGVRRTTQMLLELGHRRIGFVRYWDWPHYSVEARANGYRDEMESAGLQPRRFGQDVTVAGRPTNVNFDACHRDIEHWLLNDRPTAVMIDDDDGVPLVMHQCALHGIKVGRDISLVQISRNLMAPLGRVIATARVPTGDLGHTAAPLLLKKIEAPGTPLPSVAVPYTFDQIESSCHRVSS